MPVLRRWLSSSPGTRAALTLLAGAVVPLRAAAHGFDERYDLPAPLGYFVAGAALTVALTFVIAALFMRRGPDAAAGDGAAGDRAPRDASAADGTPSDAPGDRSIAFGPALPVLRLLCRALGLMTFAVVLGAALWGTADPLMNLAPTLVWIIWWIGLSLVVACIGNVWPVLDPWRTLFDLLDTAARRLGRTHGMVLHLPWPHALGAWPAVALLLLWSGLEVVYPIATVPYRLGCAALLWSALTLTGMLCFGREVWQRHGDVFAIYFDTLGRIAPLARGATAHTLTLRVPGAALTGADHSLAVNSPRRTVETDMGETNPAGMSGFIIAMLSTVLFDGLHGGQAWLLLERGLQRSVPQWIDVNGYFAGTVGLISVWLIFFVAYQLTCAVTARTVQAAPTASAVPTAPAVPTVPATPWTQHFAFTLVPIAVAYNIAHNFSALLIQGQNALALISDPFGWRWNLFGTANLRVNIGLIDAQVTWYVAISAIVTGHVMAVWLAHRVALRETGTARRAAAASLPLTLLMIVYTVISLLVIAEPMVRFDGAAG